MIICLRYRAARLPNRFRPSSVNINLASAQRFLVNHDERGGGVALISQSRPRFTTAQVVTLIARARHPFSYAYLQHFQTVIQPCIWFMEEASQLSVDQTAQSLTCSIMEKPHTGSETAAGMLKKNDVWHAPPFTSCLDSVTVVYAAEAFGTCRKLLRHLTFKNASFAPFNKNSNCWITLSIF